MKKITALLLALLMTLSLSAALAENNPYAVTEPITIEWWHSNEDQYTEDINVLCEKFHEQYPLITVIPRYIGSGTVLAENLIAAHAADSVPAVSQVNVGYLAEYFDSGVCTDLEPYLDMGCYFTLGPDFSAACGSVADRRLLRGFSKEEKNRNGHYIKECCRKFRLSDCL